MSARREEVSVETFADRAFTAAADAYMRTPGSWAQAVHAALAGLLGFLAERPAQTRACIADAYTGRAGLVRRDRILDRFADFLEPGYAQSDPPPPAVVSEAISGSVYELIRIYVAEERIEALPSALPDATVLALTPFVGRDEAARLAARPRPLHIDR